MSGNPGGYWLSSKGVQEVSSKICYSPSLSPGCDLLPLSYDKGRRCGVKTTLAALPSPGQVQGSFGDGGGMCEAGGE